MFFLLLSLWDQYFDRDEVYRLNDRENIDQISASQQEPIQKKNLGHERKDETGNFHHDEKKEIYSQDISPKGTASKIYKMTQTVSVVDEIICSKESHNHNDSSVSFLSESSSYYTAASPSDSCSRNLPASTSRPMFHPKNEYLVSNYSSKRIIFTPIKRKSFIHTPEHKRSVEFGHSIVNENLLSSHLKRKSLSNFSFTPNGLQPRSSTLELSTRLNLPTSNIPDKSPQDSFMLRRKDKKEVFEHKRIWRTNRENFSVTKSEFRDLSPIQIKASPSKYQTCPPLYTYADSSPCLTRGRAKTAVGALIAENEGSFHEPNHSLFSDSFVSMPLGDITNYSNKFYNVNSERKSTKKDLNDTRLGVLPPRAWMESETRSKKSDPCRVCGDEKENYEKFAVDSSNSFHDQSSFKIDDFDSSSSSYSDTWNYYEKSYEKLPDISTDYAKRQDLSETKNIHNESFNSRYALFDDKSSFEERKKKGIYDFEEIEAYPTAETQIRNAINPDFLNSCIRQPEFVITADEDGGSSTSTLSSITTFTFDRSPNNRGKSSLNKYMSKTVNNLYESDELKANCTEKSVAFDSRVRIKEPLSENHKFNGRKHLLLLSLVRRLQDDRNLLTEVKNLRLRSERDEESSSICDLSKRSTSSQESIVLDYKKVKRIRLLKILKHMISKSGDKLSDVKKLPRNYKRSDSNFKAISTLNRDSLNKSHRHAFEFVYSGIENSFKNEKNPIDREKQAIIFESNDSTTYEPTDSLSSSTPVWRAKDELRQVLGLKKFIMSRESMNSDIDCCSPSNSITPNASNKSSNISTNSSQTESIMMPYLCEPNQLRQTFDVLSRLLQKMSIACGRILTSYDTSRNINIITIEEITQCYLQLMTLGMNELSDLRSSFVRKYNQSELPRIAKQVLCKEDVSKSEQNIPYLQLKEKKFSSDNFNMEKQRRMPAREKRLEVVNRDHCEKRVDSNTRCKESDLNESRDVEIGGHIPEQKLHVHHSLNLKSFVLKESIKTSSSATESDKIATILGSDDGLKRISLYSPKGSSFLGHPDSTVKSLKTYKCKNDTRSLKGSFSLPKSKTTFAAPRKFFKKETGKTRTLSRIFQKSQKYLRRKKSSKYNSLSPNGSSKILENE